MRGVASILEAASGGDLQDREEHVAARCDGKSKREKGNAERNEGGAGRRARGGGSEGERKG